MVCVFVMMRVMLCVVVVLRMEKIWLGDLFSWVNLDVRMKLFGWVCFSSSFLIRCLC